ncbi:hypothetical protein [Shewanella surugensis]|uniref:Uncharacterized protein n=1 Tax=Shewanella surugensis TaxID=212020 RepID=A0ABT0L5X8_9GAMM|nr:hypothetical protein [Shewanella surugensis]MCL1123093.1 hypothetical protein [Shewanella surugensis]
MKLLFSLFLFVCIVGQTAAESCSMPKSFTGLTLLIRVDGNYSPENPMAGTLQEMTFNRLNYKSTIMNTRESVEGSYRYTHLDTNLGQLNMREGVGDDLSLYTETFVCETNTTGYFIFSQTKGTIKPDVRQNTGIYVIRK